jgi:iron complex outermembrane receptor protein
LEADYSLPITDKLQGDLSVLGKYRSDVWVDEISYDPNIGLQPSSFKLDVRAQVGPPNGRWDLAIVGTNLTNVTTRSYSFLFPLQLDTHGAPLAAAVLEEGRTISLEASYHF